jgi:hypothetical protein
MYVWETISRYCFKKHSFTLSIPYQHKVEPIITVVKYIPHFQRLEIYGTYSKAHTFPESKEKKHIDYHKEISYNDEEHIDYQNEISSDERPTYGLYNGVWRLEQNEKMDLR